MGLLTSQLKIEFQKSKMVDRFHSENRQITIYLQTFDRL